MRIFIRRCHCIYLFSFAALFYCCSLSLTSHPSRSRAATKSERAALAALPSPAPASRNAACKLAHRSACVPAFGSSAAYARASDALHKSTYFEFNSCDSETAFLSCDADAFAANAAPESECSSASLGCTFLADDSGGSNAFTAATVGAAPAQYSRAAIAARLGEIDRNRSTESALNRSATCATTATLQHCDTSANVPSGSTFSRATEMARPVSCASTSHTSSLAATAPMLGGREAELKWSWRTRKDGALRPEETARQKVPVLASARKYEG
mmetsp:Transcript_18503/g.60240  ORF Transcript_18503/g.60240 Transcript_18503/m.60240 type:complete len:270 (+) Transcript_18503:1676-2485(+)